MIKTQKLISMLEKARTHHDNKVLDVESLWAKLKPSDYKKRQLLIKVTEDLIKIDKSLKKWESKLIKES